MHARSLKYVLLQCVLVKYVCQRAQRVLHKLSSNQSALSSDGDVKRYCDTEHAWLQLVHC
jgi:hypothetical protein